MPRGAPTGAPRGGPGPPEYGYDTLIGSYGPQGPTGEPRRVRRARAALAVTLLTTFAVISWLTYDAVDQRLRLGMHEQLEAILDANVRVARTWLQGRQTMARDLADSAPIVEAATMVLRADGAADQESAFAARMSALRQAGAFEHYFLVSADGIVLESSAPSTLGRDLSTHPAIEGLAHAESTSTGPVPPVFAVPEEAPLRRYVLAAARLPTRPGSALLLSFDPRRLARQFGEGTWGETGEVYAFNRDGLMLTESRFTADVVRAGLLPEGIDHTALQLRLVDPGGPADARDGGARPPADRPLTLMAREATSGHSGSNVEGYRNYLGREVVGAWTWLEDYDIGVAAEVSASDAFASTLMVRKAALLLVALMLIATIGFALLGQWTLRLRRQSLLVSRRLDRLARSLQPLSAAMETDPAAVLFVNDRLRVVYANPAAARLLKTSRSLEGAHVTDVFAELSPELREALIDGQDTVVAQGEDGVGDTLLVSMRELTIEGRLHALYMLRPVTQELRRQEVEHWKKLIRVLSHELNNSLAPITSLVSSARTLAASTDRREQLDRIFTTISERTQHLLTFLESYRSVARLPRPTRQDVDWGHFIEGIRAQIEVQLEGELPTRPGYFDPAQMERVLLNLLKNAHEAGGPAREVRLRVVDEGDGTRVDVMDRGTGMSSAVLEQATLPFYSTKRTGTGVGLALAREIVEAHRGRLTLANREGGGLIASAWLPSRQEPRLTTTL